MYMVIKLEGKDVKFPISEAQMHMPVGDFYLYVKSIFEFDKMTPVVNDNSEESPNGELCQTAYMFNAPELHGKCSRPAVGALWVKDIGIERPSCAPCGKSAVLNNKKLCFELYGEDE